MTLENMLTEMNSNKGSVLLFSGNYSEKWQCHVETQEVDGTKLTIKKEGPTPADAVVAAYRTYRTLTGKAPELLSALPAPVYATFEVVLDDDIPF